MSEVEQAGLALMIVGVAFWIIGNSGQNSSTSHAEDVSLDTTPFGRQLNSLVAAYPDMMPAVPPSSFEYDGWFQEVFKRVQLRSTVRTHAEGLALLRQVSECHEHWLTITKTRKAILREAGQGAQQQELDDLDHQVKRKDLQLKIVEAEDKLKKKNEQPNKREIEAQSEAAELMAETKVADAETAQLLSKVKLAEATALLKKIEHPPTKPKPETTEEQELREFQKKQADRKERDQKLESFKETQARDMAVEIAEHPEREAQILREGKKRFENYKHLLDEKYNT